MNVLRLYDPARQPPNWTDLLRPTDFVAFSSDADSGGPVDANGRPFPSTALATCLVFESFAEARTHCEAKVAEIASLRFELFDARGRVDEPLLVIVHPSRAGTLEGNKRAGVLRIWAAVALFGAAGPLVWYDYATARGTLVLPTFLGISMALAAVRLLFMSLTVREVERARRERLRQHEP
jgi:hypothetical protein